MHRTLLALVILVRLATAPFARADEPVPAPPSIAAAAARLAQETAPAPAPRRPMEKGTMWAGAGMLLLSLPIALTGAIGDCVALNSGVPCDDSRRGAFAASGVLAGSGVALLTYAHVQRLGPEPGPEQKVMRPGLKWTGIGLLVGSAMTWAAEAQITCGASGRCNDHKDAHRWIAASMAGAGATVLATGFATRRTSWPSVVVTPGRAYLEQRFTF